MRTVRCSGRLVGGWKGVCLPRGVSAKGVSAWGCLPRRGGVCLGGVHLPPVIRIADRCKNIIFPQLRLQTVIRLSYGAGSYALDTGDLTIDCIP